MRPRAGNQSPQERRKCSYRPLSCRCPELAHALDGQDLAVGKGGLRAALAQPPPGQPAVDQAVHRDGQRRSIHAGPPVRGGDGLTAKRTGATTRPIPYTGLANSVDIPELDHGGRCSALKQMTEQASSTRA
jgi:hypothetical protein